MDPVASCAAPLVVSRPVYYFVLEFGKNQNFSDTDNETIWAGKVTTTKSEQKKSAH